MTEEQDVLQAIREEIEMYKADDKQDKFTKYTEKDLRETLSRIDFLLQNHRCSNCKKLIDNGDYDNFECSDCGIGLAETFNLETQNLEVVN